MKIRLMIKVNNNYTTYIVQWSAVMLKETSIRKCELLFVIPECYCLPYQKLIIPMKKLLKLSETSLEYFKEMSELNKWTWEKELLIIRFIQVL